MFAADNWCLKVNEKVYGPYTTKQMCEFASQGRLAAWSLIAPAGSRAWRQAQEEAVFAHAFGVAPGKGPIPAPRMFGRRDDGPDEDSPDTDRKTPSEAPRRQTVGVRPKRSNAELIIIFDPLSDAAIRSESAVLDLGDAFQIASNVWFLSCNLTAIGARNALAPYLAPHETIFVVDVATGKSAWQNYAPDLHARLTVALMAPRPARRVS